MKSLNKIHITNYSNNINISDNHDTSVTFAIVADLHEQNPDEIIKLLSQIKPDAILVPGDTFERRYKGKLFSNKAELTPLQKIKWFFVSLLIRIDDIFEWFNNHVPGLSPVLFDTEHSYWFLRESSKIAPIVMSLGNHELFLTDEDKKTIEETDTLLLDNSDCSLIIKNREFKFGGLSTKPDFEWLKRFSSEEGKKLLLCHHPEYYVNNIKGTETDTFDLIVSGHAHGGQCRFFNIPLYAPGQGIFPKYSKGQYGKMIVSTGVANTTNIPRFGNPPEIVVIKI